LFREIPSLIPGDVEMIVKELSSSDQARLTNLEALSAEEAEGHYLHT